MADQLTQDDVKKIEGAAELYEPLKRAAAVAREALAIQQASSDQRRILEGVIAEIATKKAEALDLARLAVEAADAHRSQLQGYERETEEARRKLVRLREEHADRMKAQEAEFTEARSALRTQHAGQVDAYQTEIERLTGTRDDLAAEVERLRARFQ